MKPKKITLATIKSFVKKNNDKLFINVRSHFDGMTDSITQLDGGFCEAKINEANSKYTLGVCGAWFVGGSRDYFTKYEDEKFTGYRVSNCCGSFMIAIRKPEPKQELGCYIESFLNANLTEEEKRKSDIIKNAINPDWWNDLYTDGAGNCFSDADPGL